MKRKVIALCGLKYSGKNTTAYQIRSHLTMNGQQSSEFAFAYRLKLEVCQAYGISMIELEANKEFWRPVLQFWGTEFRRIYQKNDNYWVDQLKIDLDTFFHHYKDQETTYAIVTDCRYPNEVKFLRECYDAKLLWVHRKLQDNTGNKSHSSENSVSAKNCDAIINNVGDIKFLDNEVYCALRAGRVI